ncbi:MAG TPA: capsular biosynthesis protein [Mesotoga infera]|nr:capsular biosynthesis protein [Mesotoga infera]HRR43678.1 capsular biosynthesis protein [Mesotoga sp.]HRV00936.1 capsular biosynthesis protein [Mesotoga sp.]
MNIDLHTHLLPGVDDGSSDVEESLKILERMKSGGVERVYLTPHLYSPRTPTDIVAIKESWGKHSGSLNSSGVEVLLGSEIFLRPEVLTGEIISMGETNVLLVELPTDARPHYLVEAIETLQKRGFKIILAHVERYGFLFKKSLLPFSRSKLEDEVFRLKDMGVLFQVNWDSLKDWRTVLLLEKRMVETIGSDKHHNSDGRGVIDFSSELASRFINDYYL